jgi:hypothetical protein
MRFVLHIDLGTISTIDDIQCAIVHSLTGSEDFTANCVSIGDRNIIVGIKGNKVGEWCIEDDQKQL